MKLVILLFVIGFTHVQCSISPAFRRFVRTTYGSSVERRIARDDFAGGRGSFGGGNHKAGTKTTRVPVVFVHGASTVAAHTVKMADAFRAQGYTDEELYATTFGDPTNSQYSRTGNQLCLYARGIRDLIQAVAKFTNNKVDVIAYSFGGPMSRKSILGGKCTDTGEQLGPTLKFIRSYLSVAGVQRGFNSCGVNCYPNCGDQWKNDINSRTHYEGENTYVLQSTADAVITKDRCGTYISEFKGTNRTVTTNGYGHIEVCRDTGTMQFKIINNLA
ncbi:Triacylglycerol lipase [Aphelenchoides bicaudatus]|nr:Triacylglycerol lipase [Aphelenchoides bicaudatus]